MSASVFPVLAGTVLVSRTPFFKTTQHESTSGKVDSTGWSPVRYKWSLKNEVLRESVAAPSPWGSYSEAGVVAYFFETVGQGSNEPFHIVDPFDGTTDRYVRFAEDSFSLEWVTGAPGSAIWSATFSLVTAL